LREGSYLPSFLEPRRKAEKALLAHVARSNRSMVAAALRTVFAQPDRVAAGKQLEVVAQNMTGHGPKAAQVLRDGEEDVLAYMAFPQEHWTRLYLTNPLERLNKEIKRRTGVVGIFPDVASVERLVGAILLDVHDQWQVDKRYFSQESMRTLLGGDEPLRLTAALHVVPIH